VLYRKRKLECAGDFVAFTSMEPIVTVIVTVFVGVFFHLFADAFSMNFRSVMLGAGMVMGFFGCRMLLERTTRVFRKKAFAFCGAIIAVFGLSVLLTYLDPIGITRWTPKAEDVQSVVLNRMYSSDMTEFRHTDPAIIQQVISVHQHGIQTPNSDTNGEPDITLTIQYTMKSGRKVSRQYAIDTGTLAAITLEYVLSQPEQLFGTAYPTAQAFAERASTLTVYNYKGDEKAQIIEKEDILAILEAIYADARKGDLVQEWPLISDNGRETYSVYVEDFRSPYRRTWYVSIHTQAKQTTALLDALTK
jgi:hypothetical protein